MFYGKKINDLEMSLESLHTKIDSLVGLLNNSEVLIEKVIEDENKPFIKALLSGDFTFKSNGEYNISKLTREFDMSRKQVEKLITTLKGVDYV